MRSAFKISQLFLISIAAWMLSSAVPAALRADDQELSDMFQDIPGETVKKSDDSSEISGFQSNAISLLDKTNKRFPGWGPFSRQIRDICNALELDGRHVGFKTMIDPHINSDDSCDACYTLMKMFSSSCQFKKKKIKKKKTKKGEEAEEEATPVPTPTVTPAMTPEATPTVDPEATPLPTATPVLQRQREMNNVARIRIQIFLEKLLRDHRRLEEGRVALKRIVKIISNASKWQPEGSKDYFSEVAGIFQEFLDLTELHGEDVEVADHQGPAADLHVGGNQKGDVDELFDYD